MDFAADVPIVRAELLFTKDTGKWQERYWDVAEAKLAGNNRAVATLPEGTTVYYFNLIDQGGLVTSTEHAETTD